MCRLIEFLSFFFSCPFSTQKREEDTDDGRQKPCIGGMREFGAAV
jgi:hypothetical protein